MFDITLPNAKLFKDCVDAIATLIDEGEFDISEAGMKLRAMDPSQIAMVDFVLPANAFEKFNVSSNNKIGINMDDLSKITGRVRPGEKLTLKLDESNTRLELIFKGTSTRRFNLPLLDISGMVPKQPKIEFDSKVKINGSAFKESLKDASLVSSHVVLRAREGGFDIEAKGDKGEVKIETKKDDDAMLEHTVNAEAKAMFPLEYLNDLLKGADAGAVVQADMKTDAPLKVEYCIGEATITYYLAPRIENA